MVGDVNVFINNEVGELEIMIAEEEWRKRGLAFETLKLMIRYCFDHLNLVKFVAKIDENNLPSILLFKKLGFIENSFNEVFREFHFILDSSNLFHVIGDVNLQIMIYSFE